MIGAGRLASRLGPALCREGIRLKAVWNRTEGPGLKLARETGAEYIVSNDSSCLMHIQGLLDRRKSKMKTIHLAEVLAAS